MFGLAESGTVEFVGRGIGTQNRKKAKKNPKLQVEISTCNQKKFIRFNFNFYKKVRIPGVSIHISHQH
jgi:hypothetical protein